MAIAQPKKFKILLLGDNCRDIYRYGHVNRLSPEAPVPVFESAYEVEFAGMAGNVCENLSALNCDVTYLHTDTSIKQRLIDIKTKQHLLRMDTDMACHRLMIRKNVLASLSTFDAIVISDYNKGTIDRDLILNLRRSYSGPVFIDTKIQHLEEFSGCYVKINAQEFARAKTVPADPWLIVTLGARGARWNGQQYAPEHAAEVVDVCGAGDTFLSALTVKFLETNDMTRSIAWANQAAAVTVQHVGVYAPTRKEIDAS